MVTMTVPLPNPFQLSGPALNSMPPPSSTVPSRKRKLVPLASSPSVSDSSADQDQGKDEEYEPGPSARSSNGGGAKRSRAPTQATAQGPAVPKPTKGMSREALRKANHSLIERRRREKINHALGELRDMVPGLGEAGGGKGGEFKLEVLERTVEHMKHLKSHILDLEAKVAESSGSSEGSSSAPLARRTLPKPAPVPASTTTPARKRTTPPSPSSSLDPNETDLESNLPPALTLASRPIIPSFPSESVPPAHSRPSSPSITSLLASIPDRPPLPHSRPEASAQAYNPTLYLPFPTPSPTSPFLTYSHGGSTASSSLGPPEPSPFLAPLQGMPLFGGALSLDHILAPSPKDALGLGAGTDMEIKGRSGGGGEKEHEAANVLLAFSSPDVMRPSLGMTPIVQAHKGIQGGTRERRGTLDSEEFVLDRETESGPDGQGGKKRDEAEERGVRGKTAREILRM